MEENERRIIMEINAIMWFYGCNKTKAKELLRKLPESTITEVVRGFRNNATKSFYED